MAWWYRGLAAGAVAVCLLVAPGAGGVGTAIAATETSGAPRDVQARRDALFQRMLTAPGDVDAAFEYARLSVEAGDYEGAISTLERLLIFAPGLPRLQLELGVLYYRIGAYQTAQSYLEQALASPAVPPEVRSKADIYLQQIAAQLDPPAFYGSVYSGIRWQSNANSAPTSGTVTLNGLTFTLDEEATSSSDFSVLNVGTLNYVKDLHNQGDRFEAHATGYSARYFDQSQVNLEFAEANIGPSFNLKRFGIAKSRLYTYGIGDVAVLEDDLYFASAGGGLAFTTFAFDKSRVEVLGEVRVRAFDDSTQRPNVSLRDGPQTRVGVNYYRYLTARLMFSLYGQYQREATDADFFANDEYSVTGGVTWSFANPFAAWREARAEPVDATYKGTYKPAADQPVSAWYARPWLLQVSAGGIWRNYDAPDPTINFFDSEDTDIFWGRAAVIIPVTETLALIPQVEYRDQRSNYDIRAFDNFTAMIGLNKQF